MPNRCPTTLRTALAFTLVFLSGLPGAVTPLAAQEVDPTEEQRLTSWTADPLLPRGRILVGLSPSGASIFGLHGGVGDGSLGAGFFLPEFGPAQAPELADAADRLTALMGEDPPTWSLRLGSVGGYVHADEQVLPVHIGYGFHDRVSAGVTVPFVRRRVDSRVTLAGTGATVGENPLSANPGAVSDFLSGAQEALAALQAFLDTECNGEENGSEGALGSCEGGEDLLARASGFLSELEFAYQEETVFPLRGSSGAAAIQTRWDGFRSALDEFGLETPETLPVANLPLSDATFADRFVDPIWGSGGFPRESPEAFLEMGDVELHLVLGLIQPDQSSATPDGGFRVRSTLIASVRLPTGTVDTLQAVAPFGTPRGVAGAGARLVTDALLPGGFAVLGVVEGWWHGEAETSLLAPDPSRVLGVGAIARTPATWRPGPTLRIRAVPRFHVVPPLSLGAGYEIDHRGAHSYTLAHLPDVVPPGAGGSSTVHRMHAEARFHGTADAEGMGLPFPIEAAFTYSRSLSGSGQFAPSDRRVGVLIRVLRER
jgi:hypothetical protein